MTGRPRLRAGWLITGVAAWLMVASSIGLEHGHSKLADVGTLLAISIVGLAVGFVVLRLAGRAIARTARLGWAGLRRSRSRSR